jgi:hypothetical protein
MSAPIPSVKSLYLPGVEDNPQPGYAITTCALFNFYNRWITPTGVPEMSAEHHRQQGKALASRGYVRD